LHNNVHNNLILTQNKQYYKLLSMLKYRTIKYKTNNKQIV